MTFEEAGEIFVQLRQQFDQGTITQHEFEKKVAELVVLGPDGITWQLEPNTGTWIQAGAPQSSIPARKKAEPKPPETLFQLAVQIVKTLISNLPKTIIMGLLMAGLTWVAHTYIIAKINDGLMYKAHLQVVNAVVHLQKTYFPGVDAFWGLLSYFLSNFFGRIFAVGLINWIRSILLLPVRIYQSFIKVRLRGISLLLFSAGLALLVSYFIKNFMVSWILSFGLLLTLTAHFQSIETMVLRLALSDFQRLFRIKLVSKDLEFDSIYLTLLGLSAGFALAGLWRTRVTYNLISFIVLILLFIAFLFLMKRREAQKVVLFLMVLIGGVFLLYLPVFAWCEGASLSRVGGSWTKWWGMRNADVVRKLGIMPAASSFLGSLLGSAGALTSALIPGLGSWLTGPSGAPGPKVITPPSKTITDPQKLEQIRRRNEEIKKAQQEAAQANSIWGLIKATLSNSKKEVVDTAKDAANAAVNLTKQAASLAKQGAKATYEGVKKIYHNPSIVTDTLKSGLNKVKDTVRDAANGVKGIVKDIYNNPSIITDTLKGMAGTTKDALVGIASTTGKIVKGVGKAIYTTVTDPKKLWGFVKDAVKDSVGWDNFKNSIDPNRSLASRIGQSLIGTGKLGLTLLTFGAGAVKKEAVKAAAKAAASATTKTIATTGAKSAVKSAVRTGVTAPLKTAGTKSVAAAGTKSVAATGVKATQSQATKQAANFVKQASDATKGTFTPSKLPKLTGLTQKEVTAIQKGAQKLGLDVKVRPPSFEGRTWLGKAIPKPEMIKNKTLGTLDNLLGAKGPPGLIGSYKPDKNLARNLINNIKNNPGIPPSRKDQMIKEVMSTYKQRYKEFNQNKGHLQQLIDKGKINIKNGVIFDKKTGKPFMPDVDFFSINKVGGGPASASEKKAFFDYLKSQGVRVEHGSHLDWRPTSGKDFQIFNKIIKGHGKGGEALINFGPKGIGGQYYTP